MEGIETLQRWMDESSRIVFFGGAGVSTESGVPDFRSPDGLYADNLGTKYLRSTESGIPDFRSVDGLYHQQYQYPPETILSRSFFDRQPEEFYRFYRSKMLCLDAKPNAAHKKLAELERGGRLRSVVTQNIDGLHQAAGSRRVWELHGSVLRNRCMSCGKLWPVSAVAESSGVPRCACGGVIKPDVVLYEEGLDQGTLEAAVRALAEADMLMIGGTSLNVYPAAGLIRYYQGHKLVLLNKSPVARDLAADLVITDPIGETLAQL